MSEDEFLTPEEIEKAQAILETARTKVLPGVMTAMKGYPYVIGIQAAVEAVICIGNQQKTIDDQIEVVELAYNNIGITLEAMRAAKRAMDGAGGAANTEAVQEAAKKATKH